MKLFCDVVGDSCKLGGRLGRATGQGPKWRLSRFEVMRPGVLAWAVCLRQVARAAVGGAEWPPQHRRSRPKPVHFYYCSSSAVQSKTSGAVRACLDKDLD